MQSKLSLTHAMYGLEEGWEVYKSKVLITEEVYMSIQSFKPV